MKLREFTTTESDDGETITAVCFRLADHADRERSKEWIDVQLAIDVPTIRNGALLRAEALEKARDALDQLSRDYSRLGRRPS
ncbi:MAG TPA: hypothetical protein VGC50_13865 [Gammaproteobacteria bacterium]